MRSYTKIVEITGGNPSCFKKHTQDILPKELKILKTPPSANENYNCFIYVLGLADNSDLIKDCGGFIYDTLFQKLLDDGRLEYTTNPQSGNYILYRNLENYPDMITHAGIIEDNNVIISKWAWGPLFRHKIFDVPESYGDNISYVKSISKEKSRTLYENIKV